MSEVEILINDLNNQIIKLQGELEEAKKDIEDFETIAHVWKKSYEDMEMDYKIKLANAEQTIKQLETDLEDYKNRRD